MNDITYEIIENLYKSYEGSINRLIIGKKINSNLSKMENFRPQYGFTGNIGYIDYQITMLDVPKTEAKENTTDHSDYIKMLTFRILIIGIEPEYRSKGYFSSVVEFIYNKARESKCQCIVFDTIENDKLKRYLRINGAKLFFKNAIKYL